MATKKQKRLAGEARALEQREESRKSGLRAQQRDRELREKRQKAAAAEAIKENRRLETILATKKMAGTSE